MQTELALIVLLGGVVALDKTEAFQTMLSQPLLIGPLAGLCLSDLQGGLRIGVLLQLAYLWIGGVYLLFYSPGPPVSTPA